MPFWADAYSKHVPELAARSRLDIGSHDGSSAIGELDAVVGQHGVDPVGDGLDQGLEEARRRAAGGFLMQFDEGELRGSVDGHEKVELALLGAHLGDIDVEVADRISLELASCRACRPRHQAVG